MTKLRERLAELVAQGVLTLPPEHAKRGRYSQCSPDEISCTVAADGKSITFEPCGRTSFHPKDVEERYCGSCHRWMGLLEAAREIRKEHGLE